MTNLETLNSVFAEVFGVDASQVGAGFTKDTVAEWDSVHQLGIIAGLEDNFDLMLDPEDIVACTSYDAAKDILKKYDVEI